MQLGVDGVFVGSGIFKSSEPGKRARAMVQAVTHYNDPKILAQVSINLGDPMVSLASFVGGFHICVHGFRVTTPQVGVDCDDLKQRWATREQQSS